MNEKDKSILLTDLCGRLPYDLICHYDSGFGQADLRLVGYYGGNYQFLRDDGEVCCFIPIEWIKPYLRTISSMTDEEREKFEHISPGIVIEDGLRLPNVNQINWLNCKHFDYRGLIEKDLALEAPGDMYVFKSA